MWTGNEHFEFFMNTFVCFWGIPNEFANPENRQTYLQKI